MLYHYEVVHGNYKQLLAVYNIYNIYNIYLSYIIILAYIIYVNMLEPFYNNMK